MDVALTSKAEKAVTRLGMWGAMRAAFPITTALLGSVLLLESLTTSVARLLPRAPVNAIHAVAIGAGLLLGLFGHFLGEFWDRRLFEAAYGPQGYWRDAASRPLSLFPPGAPLKKLRSQAAHAMKLEALEGFYRQAVKLARRQVERWELVEHPLILSWTARGLLGPCLVAAVAAASAAGAAALLGAVGEIPRLLAIGLGSLLLAALLLVCYADHRMEHMLRLYQDVATHPAKKK
jgi:hypothetical protein